MAIAQSLFAIPNMQRNQAQETMNMLELNESFDEEFEKSKRQEDEVEKQKEARHHSSTPKKGIERDVSDHDEISDPPIQKYIKK